MELKDKSLLKKLTQANEKKFFINLEENEVFLYSFSYSAWEVEVLAKNNGVLVKYNEPRTEKYIKYGDASCTFVGKIQV